MNLNIQGNMERSHGSNKERQEIERGGIGDRGGTQRKVLMMAVRG